MRAIFTVFFLLNIVVLSDDHIQPPPTPELNYKWDRVTGEFVVEFISDSNDPKFADDPRFMSLRPVWYILEVLDQNLFGPESPGWIRPIAIIHDAQFNTLVTINTNINFNPDGFIRIIAIWGA